MQYKIKKEEEEEENMPSNNKKGSLPILLNLKSTYYELQINSSSLSTQTFNTYLPQLQILKHSVLNMLYLQLYLMQWLSTK